MSSAKAFHERRIPSGVRGLDHLLKGGIPSLDPHPQGISILLRGAPGTGKTVLAAQLCCNGFLAKSLPEEAQKAGWTSFKRFRVVYYDLEQSLERFQNLLDAFGFEPMAVAKPEEGPLTHPRVTSYAPDELKKYVNEHLKSSNQDERYLLVIDGIDAFQEPFFDRSTLDVIRSNLLDQGHWILFLAEAVSEHYSKYPFVDYMADVVMELRVRKVEEYSRRLIEIVKCRGSEYIRGEHVFMILPKAKDEGTAKRLGEPGVRVFPSLDAKLSHWKEAEAFCTRYTFDFGISGLNEMLGSSDRTGPQTTLYIGPAGSGKAATALHFAVADCTGKCPRKTVLISFGCEEHSLASLAWQYEALRDLVDEQRMKFREDRIKFVYIAPSFLHAPKLLCRLENEIAGTDARKAIVIDLSHVRHRFPALNDEPMLFSALVQFFKYYKMCPIFVESLVLPSEEVESTGHFATPMASLADNVVEFRRLFFYGKDHICIRFHVTHGMPAEPGYRELVVSGPQDKPRRISVERTLDGFTDFFTGKPRRVPLGVYFFYENDLQFEFNQRLSRMLECAFPGLSVHRDLKIMGFTPQTAPSVARGLEFTTGSPQPDIRIAQLDEFWVETFRPEMLIPDPFSKD
ncbi:MAG: AAA family ATPase, partial [Deltaproteobacteria bacterium]|nr:AAA family ATPase [Deltaproteobacteria bacterium]